MNPELISKLTFFALLLAAVFLEIIADVSFKKWSLGNRNAFLIIGFMVYSLGTVFWAISLKYGPLSRAISVFTLLNLILISLVGVIFFKENLSPVNKLGIILGIVSIILVEIL